MALAQLDSSESRALEHWRSWCVWPWEPKMEVLLDEGFANEYVYCCSKSKYCQTGTWEALVRWWVIEEHVGRD